MMGGVDRMAQNINHLRISIGGKKWYWSIVTWILDTCLQNNWQLVRKAGSILSALEFRRQLVKVLLREDIGSRTTIPYGISNRAGHQELRYDIF